MDDNAINLIITALLPLTACMLVLQVNPYHALIIRGVLGAIAALVYAVLGAADVALTEALMGTLLAVILLAVTVRSSLVLRLGVLEVETTAEGDRVFEPLLADLRTFLDKHYMRLEVIPYTDLQALDRALRCKEVHATCWRKTLSEASDAEIDTLAGDSETPPPELPTDLLTVRVQHIYDILKDELSSPGTLLNYVQVPNSEEKH
ncbi:MAG: DUF4040 domain-containing protein [Cyanobacteriota bacterium]|nr:DUF4040 domain-containing protein [Cyanobacteriota bacterium]